MRSSRRIDLNGATNMEVRFAWLDLAVANRYEPAVPSLEQFLPQGARQIRQAAVRGARPGQQWGRPIAKRIYAEARPLYHPMVTRDLDQLHLPQS